MARVIFNRFKLALLQKEIDFDTAAFMVMLVASGYTPDKDLHEDRADVTNEHSDASYTAGGNAVGSVAATQDDVDDEGVVDGNDVVFSNLDGSDFAAYVLYLSTGVAANDLLIMYDDTPTELPVTPNGTDFTITWAAEGILNLNE